PAHAGRSGGGVRRRATRYGQALLRARRRGARASGHGERSACHRRCARVDHRRTRAAPRAHPPRALRAPRAEQRGAAGVDRETRPPMLTRLLDLYAERRRLRRALTVTLDAARVRAGSGAAYLDGVDPGWHTRLNPATLELADGAQCVLGQLHGGFRAGLFRARILDLSSAPLASLSPVDL